MVTAETIETIDAIIQRDTLGYATDAIAEVKRREPALQEAISGQATLYSRKINEELIKRGLTSIDTDLDNLIWANLYMNGILTAKAMLIQRDSDELSTFDPVGVPADEDFGDKSGWFRNKLFKFFTFSWLKHQN